MRSVADAPNRIPAAPIVAVVEAYLAVTGDRIGDGVNERASVFSLAAQADIHQNTLEKILNGKTATIDFDLADRLLCAANMNDLWRTDLREIYDGAQLVDDIRQHKAGSATGSRVCIRRGCSNQFVPPINNPRKRFCSNACRSADWKQRRFGVISPAGPGRKLRELVCKNGHERTPENTVFQGGRKFCRICKRETDRKSAKRYWDAKKSVAV
jgi:hypothetical protein